MSAHGSVVGLITARGGSKGIPRKNLRSVGGRPMIAWTVEAAVNSPTLHRIYLSTDDAEIASVARSFGTIETLFRSPSLASDTARHPAVVAEAWAQILEVEEERPDWLVLLQPTSPLRSSADITAAVELAVGSRADSVVSVSETSVHPYLLRSLGDDGRLTALDNPSSGRRPRQELAEVYTLNGAIYVLSAAIAESGDDFETENTLGYVMPADRSIDIDTEFELEMADLLMRSRSSS